MRNEEAYREMSDCLTAIGRYETWKASAFPVGVTVQAYKGNYMFTGVVRNDPYCPHIGCQSKTAR